MVSQHVEHTNSRQSRSKQIRPLRQDRADEQAAVAAAVYRQPGTARVVLVDEVFGSPDKIVEDILLVGQRPGSVPRLPVFPTTSEICLGVHTTHLEPRQHRRPESRCEGYVESAIAIQQDGLISIL